MKSIKKYKSILFDFDGTLVNLDKYKMRFTNQFINNHNISVSNPENLFSSVYKGDCELSADLQEIFKIENKKIQVSQIKFMDGIDNILNYLFDDGYILGIVSSSPKDRIISILAVKGKSHLFSLIIGSEDTIEHKPSGQPLIKALEKLSLSKEEAIYIGDTLDDFESANNANVDCVLYVEDEINFRYINKKLEKNPPLLITKDFQDLGKLL